MNIPSFITEVFPNREKATHKGHYGKGLIIGGTKGMTGSVYMSSLAALRTGLGLAYIAAPNNAAEILEIKSVEQIIHELNTEDFSYTDELFQEIKTLCRDKDALAIGPGMGLNVGINKLIEEIIQDFQGPIVMDADGLNAISQNTEIIKNHANLILTPHEMEFSRLSKIPVEEINSNRLETALSFAKEFAITLVLKGSGTIVTNGEDYYINGTGNPGMATAGSGDVLTGIILALIARGVDPLTASKSAVFLHGLAGDLATKEFGEDSLIATDIIKHIPDAIKLIKAVT